MEWKTHPRTANESKNRVIIGYEHPNEADRHAFKGMLGRSGWDLLRVLDLDGDEYVELETPLPLFCEEDEACSFSNARWWWLLL